MTDSSRPHGPQDEAPEYEAYIHSGEWASKTARMRAMRPWKDCERCLRKPMGGPLEVHHLHYRTLGNESPRDLIVVCRACHEAAHGSPVVQAELEQLASHHPSSWDDMPRTRFALRMPRPRPVRH